MRLFGIGGVGDRYVVSSIYLSGWIVVGRLGNVGWRGGLRGFVSLGVSLSSYFSLSLLESGGGGGLKFSENEE